MPLETPLVLAAFEVLHVDLGGGELDHLGNDDQKRWAQLMIEKRWGATMVLTEPDAGSDVGAGRAKAFDNGDGTWRIEGVKRFITSGEHDMTDNIVHLVLARPEGANAIDLIAAEELAEAAAAAADRDPRGRRHRGAGRSVRRRRHRHLVPARFNQWRYC